MSTSEEISRAEDVAVRRLPLIRGRAPRVVSLVYNDASRDSRVLKTTATLRAAGADARIVASARDHLGHPAGVGMVGDLEVHRVADLSLVRMFPRLAAAWRSYRARGAAQAIPSAPQRADTDSDTHTAASSTPSTEEPTDITAEGGMRHTGPGPTPAQASAPTQATLSAPAPARSGPVALAADIWMRTYGTARLASWWLGAVREARALRPDVVHSNDANALVPALLTTVGTGGKVIYDSHELWRHRNILRRNRWLAPYVEAAIESVGIRLSAGVITVSPSIAEWLRRTYALPTLPTLVRNIPTSRGLPDPAQGRLRELAGLGAQDRVVSYVGGITTGRGLEETVDALALLPADTHLVLLGYGDQRYIDGLLARAAAAGVGERVHLAGAVPSAEVPQALADADVAVVFVRPICLSYEFSLPNKLFESIHAGLPIVAADLPDTAEVVRRYGVGQVFDATTPEDLADAIRQVLADPEAYREASRAAAAELTWEHEAGQLVDLYARVLEGRRG
ncbi:glycosyltransferase [Ornithinimicrobium sp. Y1694]|uniref:glycosyltransferase n=1 Tax=Ornithinimicrobium sp. Y1694 TaxID=3418590 RepID=UPI003CF208A2